MAQPGMTAAKLASERKRLSLTYAALADALGGAYTRGYLCNLEKGQRPISEEAAKVLTAFFEKGQIIRPVWVAHHRDERGRFTSATYQAGD